MNQFLKNCIIRFFVILAALILPTAFCINQSAYSQVGESYKDFESFEASLKSMVKSNSDLAELESIGKTNEGRDIWLLTIAGKSGDKLESRPGLLISGNAEGDHLVGSELALGSIEYLLDNYDSDESIKKALNENVFYFLPRINPDGAEKNFDKIISGIKTNSTPYDGDNDGRLDEDGPEDLNGDGIITVMRVKDPNGKYMIDPDNSFIMKVADPVKGETGGFNILWEGIDNDGDGFINEDPVGGIDINRNFQHAYPYHKPDAGIHMVSEKETRAVLDWMLANKNIAMMLSFTESDNLITAPSGGEIDSDKQISLNLFADASIEGASKVGMVSTGGGRFSMFMFGGARFSRGGAPQQASSGRSRPSRKPATTINKDDQEYYSLFSKKYKEITGIESQPPVRKPAGSLFEYGYYQYGVPSLATPGWGMDMPKDTVKKEESTERPAMGRRGAGMRGARTGMGGSGASKGTDALVYKWLKENNESGIIEWQTVNHPEFGEVEVGGFNPLAITNPPVEMISELGEKHGKYAVYLSTLFADVSIAETEVVNHGGGIFRIKAEIENTGFLPTALAHGVASRGVKPTMVQLGVNPDAILSGNSKTNYIQKLEGSGKRQKYEWLIKGKSGDKIELKVVSQKGGSDTSTIELK